MVRLISLSPASCPPRSSVSLAPRGPTALLLRLDASFLDRGGPLYELGPNESIEILGPAPVDFCPGLLESLLDTGFNESFSITSASTFVTWGGKFAGPHEPRRRIEKNPRTKWPI